VTPSAAWQAVHAAGWVGCHAADRWEMRLHLTGAQPVVLDLRPSVPLWLSVP
jgi:hypothetical protein